MAARRPRRGSRTGSGRGLSMTSCRGAWTGAGCWRRRTDRCGSPPRWIRRIPRSGARASCGIATACGRITTSRGARRVTPTTATPRRCCRPPRGRSRSASFFAWANRETEGSGRGATCSRSATAGAGACFPPRGGFARVSSRRCSPAGKKISGSAPGSSGRSGMMAASGRGFRARPAWWRIRFAASRRRRTKRSGWPRTAGSAASTDDAGRRTCCRRGWTSRMRAAP